jgi:hypothetical protein
MTEFLHTNLRRRLFCLPQTGNSGIEREEVSARLKDASRVDEKLTILATARLATTTPIPAAFDQDQPIGVVIEFGVAAGTDVFAAYSDGWMGWYDSTQKTYIEGKASGAAVAEIADLIGAAKSILNLQLVAIDREPQIPGPGDCSVSVITETGIHCGHGTSRAMATDRFGARVIRAALSLRTILLSGSKR